jgi:LPS export ABC transporter protein LptC
MGPFWANAVATACVLTALGLADAARSDEVAPPALELEGITFVSTEGVENQVVLTAERARVETDGRVAHLENVHVLLASDRRIPGLDMRCDRGTVDIETSDFEAHGKVRGTTGDGRRFRTSRLHYANGPGLVSTDSKVVIEDETGTYSGSGFRYFVRENRFRLNGAATVVQQ